MIVQENISVFWFRRDLRLDDNAALYHALNSGYKVLPIFIFDTAILNQFEKPRNAQVEFIHESILHLKKELEELSSSILIGHATPVQVFEEITGKYSIKAVYTNEDYELSALKRDAEIEEFLKTKGIEFHSYKDQVIFSKNEVLKDDGNPYTVFTPYSKKWKYSLSEFALKPYECDKHFCNFYPFTSCVPPSLSDLGYTPRGILFPPKAVDDKLISSYNLNRDYPSVQGTSHLSVHLRFGTISIRSLVKKAVLLNDIFLNELIWREFYYSITWHFPHVGEGYSFKSKYDEIPWLNNESDFAAWCEGKTGYPLVDAGMRELNSTGYMHNRARMITASFLVKHLLIDWRWGEAYFANRLLDFDFSANNGGWQWAAGCGCDAVPYFRIFSPTLQAQRFDKDGTYIRQWIPEIESSHYPKPIVDHDFARKRAIETYKKLLEKP